MTIRRWFAAVVLAAAMTLAGCGVHPLVPAAPGRETPPARHAGPPPLLGVDLYALSNYPKSVLERDGQRDLYYIKHTLGADAVGIVWNLYEHNLTGSQVRATPRSLTPANVAILTKLAKADGLQVEYRPLLAAARGAGWVGLTQPESARRWFRSFYRAEHPYLQLAEEYHIREFVTSTELVALNHNPGWRQFFRTAARVYHGVISYASFSTDFWNPWARHLLPVRFYGTTAYPGFHLAPTATVADLEAAWQQVFNQVPLELLRRTALDEIGIPAARDAYTRPWAWSQDLGALDEQVQANWFTAACYVVEQYSLRAVFFWNVNLTDNPRHPSFPDLPAFEGKQGAAAIRGCRGMFGTNGRGA